MARVCKKEPKDLPMKGNIAYLDSEWCGHKSVDCNDCRNCINLIAASTDYCVVAGLGSIYPYTRYLFIISFSPITLLSPKFKLANVGRQGIKNKKRRILIIYFQSDSIATLICMCYYSTITHYSHYDIRIFSNKPSIFITGESVPLCDLDANAAD